MTEPPAATGNAVRDAARVAWFIVRNAETLLIRWLDRLAAEIEQAKHG